MMVEEPYLREFLRFLRPELLTALATNRTTTTRAVLAYHGLTDGFDLVVSAQDVSRPKPHPESFVRILDHFGCPPGSHLHRRFPGGRDNSPPMPGCPSWPTATPA